METFDEILTNHFHNEGKSFMFSKDKSVILSAMREACEQAIDKCAENAECMKDEVEGKAFNYRVNKQSILNVKKLLK